MFVRTPRRAIRLLLTDLQATVSCVTQAVLRADLREEPTQVAVITFGGIPPRASVGRAQQRWIEVNVTAEARQDDVETQSWRTHTLRYDFALYDSPDGGKFLLAYHFHPDPQSRGYQRPHVHVGVRPGWTHRSLERTHLPTGRVPCEAFVRLLIEELGIRRTRADWDRVLARSEARFEERRTW